ncbi:6987_t:CDS:2, partial [Funneliformis geosporum]
QHECLRIFIAGDLHEFADSQFGHIFAYSNYLKPKLSKNSFTTGWLDENLTADKPDKIPLFNDLYISTTDIKITIDYEVVIVQPPQLQITIYETNDEQEGCLKVHTFTIEPENELMHISKFDHPEHPIIWNNKTNRMELRVDTIQGSTMPFIIAIQKNIRI